MKTLFHSLLLVAAVAASSALAAPSLSTGGARNAASLSSTSGIAQGARFTLLGKDLGPADAVTNEAYPLSMELGGVTVKVTIGDTTLDAWVLSASAKRVTALLPSSAPVGQGKVTLSYNGESAEGAIEVVSRAVGLFTTGATGSGAVVALVAESGANVALSASVKPGQQVRLRATGLGATEGDEAGGPTPKALDTTDVEVLISDKPAVLVGASRTETAGVDELLVEIPAGVEGCFAPIVVRTGSKYSNFVTIAVAANGGYCSSNQFTGGTLETAAAAGELRVGTISLARAAITAQQADLVTDSAGGSFIKYKFEDYGAAGAGSQSDFAVGSCMIFNPEPFDEPPAATFVPPVDLHAGVLTVTGPKGVKNLGDVKGNFSVELGTGISIALPPGVPPLPSNLYLEPGDYTVAGAGGTDVGAFSVQVRLNPVDWTNPTVAANVNRSQPLTLNWTGGGANDYVMAMGVSTSGVPAPGALPLSATFICIAKASAGKITVGTHILQNLPASVGEGSILGLFSITEPKTFKASGLDAGTLIFSRLAARQASYR